MTKDYVPAKLTDYKLFSDHFVDLVSQKSAAWGIPDTAKAKLTGGHTAWKAAQDIPGAKAVYEELKTRFPGGKRKSGETGTET